MKFNLKKEAIFFGIITLLYLVFYFAMMKGIGETFNTTSFTQTAIVFFLVCYLTRAIFVIMKLLKENP